MKFARFINSIFALTVIITIVSHSQNLIPLSVGNKYVYSFTNYDTSGVIESVGIDSFVVVSDTVITSETWFFDGYGYSTNRLDGFYTMNLGSQPELLFKYPANVDDRYATNAESVCVVSVNTPMTVPSGSYSCYFYEFRWLSDGTLKYRWYVVPNLFYVYKEKYSKTGSGTLYRSYKIELLSYSIVSDVSYKATTPITYSLSQNYPNPFNPSTTIEYQVPTRSHVSLRIFDVLGREVATLVNGIEEPGYKSVNFNANGLVSGVYYYRMQAGNYIETKKLLLLR